MSGAERVILAPAAGLKSIQKCLNLILQTIYVPHPAATGFVPRKSIVDNAKIHSGSLYVYNIDLKDFFPSIDQARVWGRLKHPPFNLNEKNGTLELANIIASLCCEKMDVERLDENKEWQSVARNVLPQGSTNFAHDYQPYMSSIRFLFDGCSKTLWLKIQSLCR